MAAPPGKGLPPEPKSRKPEVSAYILAAFGVVLVGGIFVLLVIAKGMATGSFYRNAEGKITRPTSRVASPGEQVLATFEPPVFPLQPAKDQSVPSETFHAGMDFYQQKMYLRAIPLLRVAADRRPDFLTPRFYLGICFLLTDRGPIGIKELRKVAAAGGENPYREAARFYLAKALIGRNDLPDAGEQLQTVIAMHGPYEHDARDLVQKISALP